MRRLTRLLLHPCCCRRLLQDADRLSQLREKAPDDFDSELMDDAEVDDMLDEVCCCLCGVCVCVCW